VGQTQRDLLREDYRLAGTRAVAYIDESYSTSTQPGQNFYILTAVVVTQVARDDLRLGIEDVAEGDYWHTTDILQRPDGVEWTKEMLDYLARGNEVSVISLNQSVDADDADGESARRECFERVLPALQSGAHEHGPIGFALLEARRDRQQQNFDHLVYQEMVKSGRLSRHFKLRQASPRDEHLLWLPDVVCSAVRRKVTGKGADLFEVIEPTIIWA